MAFDIEGARRAGYSDAEIADHLAREARFDAAGARQAGFSDAEIVSHLAGAQRPAQRPAVGVGDYLSGVKRAIEGGLTFGLRDELGALVNAGVETAGDALTGRNPDATFGSRYDAALGRERQAARMADWLNRQLPAGTKVYASPAVRAQQTAAALERFMPEALSAVVTLLAPGKGLTLRPACRTADTRRAPGSLTAGVPASLT